MTNLKKLAEEFEEMNKQIKYIDDRDEFNSFIEDANSFWLSHIRTMLEEIKGEVIMTGMKAVLKGGHLKVDEIVSCINKYSE